MGIENGKRQRESKEEEIDRMKKRGCAFLSILIPSSFFLPSIRRVPSSCSAALLISLLMSQYLLNCFKRIHIPSVRNSNNMREVREHLESDGAMILAWTTTNKKGMKTENEREREMEGRKRSKWRRQVRKQLESDQTMIPADIIREKGRAKNRKRKNK